MELIFYFQVDSVEYKRYVCFHNYYIQYMCLWQLSSKPNQRTKYSIQIMMTLLFIAHASFIMTLGKYHSNLT